MKNSDKKVKFIVFVLSIIIVADLIGLFFYMKKKSKEISNEAQTATSAAGTAGSEQIEEGLSAPEDFLPQNLIIGEKPPVQDFTDEEGKKVSLSQYETEPLWIVFWASWCPDCRNQLGQAAEMQKLADKYGVKILLIDRLNPEKESVKAAQEELKNLGISFDCIYDQNEYAYKKWGIQEIPTGVVLNKNGCVAGYTSNTISMGQAEAMLQNALYGYDRATFDFIEKKMCGKYGEIYINNKNETASPSGNDSLSESMGLMMQYAAATQNKSLFERLWNTTQNRFEVQGLAAWYVDEDGTKADSNALLDDIRIWSALKSADKLWGGYGKSADQIRNAIYTRCTDKKHNLVSFCNFSVDSRASDISMCYLCPEELNQMANEESEYKTVTQEAQKILTNAKISDHFPLYYSSYNYITQKYSHEDLNTAEALYTIYNLAASGLVEQDTLNWISDKVESGSLGARYHVDGTVVKGYEYHSTALYGLAALIARQAGDTETFNKAIQRMERYRISDTSSEYNGAFTADADGYESFDQLIPLLVYAERNKDCVK